MFIKKKLKWFTLLAFSFFILMISLPRPDGYGVRLERLYSVLKKRDNYSETIKIISKHPVFGVGYNNMCAARIKYLGDIGYESHSCSGSDSGILLIIL